MANLVPAATPEGGLTLCQMVEREAALLQSGEINLLRGYAKLARLLMMVKLNEAWRDAGHSSLNAYILSLEERYNRKPQTLYAYISAAEKLLPYAGEEGLDRMGITKAMEIVRAANKAKKDISQALVNEAMKDEVTADEVRALAHRFFELNGEMPKGKYVDVGGFYADEEQYKTFVEAVKISMRVLNLPPEMPDHIKRMRIILFWAAEINGTYAADVYGEDGVGGTKQ
jgi:hypothetical protein